MIKIIVNKSSLYFINKIQLIDMFSNYDIRDLLRDEPKHYETFGKKVYKKLRTLE